MLKNIILLIVVSFFMGCSETPTPVIESVDPPGLAPEYNFYSMGANDTFNPTSCEPHRYFFFIGDSVDGKWDFDNKYVWLSTDTNRVEGPYGTLTIFFGNASSSGWFINSAVLSLTDKLKGTAAELNARTYSAGSGLYFSPIEVNEGVIWGKLNMDMIRTSPNNSSEPMAIELNGEFAALKK
jgi:hypothetical protein